MKKNNNNNKKQKQTNKQKRKEKREKKQKKNKDPSARNRSPPPSADRAGPRGVSAPADMYSVARQLDRFSLTEGDNTVSPVLHAPLPASPNAASSD